jgi:Predicted ATP-dependent endonuclease of the OLD family
MKISKINIKNYRNLKNVDLSLNRLVIFIGENNSGKSNILKAITLPLMNDEVGNISKNIGWQDINNDSKNVYFSFIQDNLVRIKNEEVTLEEFIAILPNVIVEMNFTPDGSDEFYVRKWINAVDGEEPHYSIKYKFEVSNPKKLLEHITMILKVEESIDKIKMNLLPIDYYKYSITVTSTDEQVSFNDLSNFIYNSLAAERDEFSNKNTQLGSKALVNLLNNKLKEDQKVAIEKSYESFFSDLKSISNIEGIFNWQEASIIENAKDFFKEITLLPNMPSMSSLLNNVRLGFGEEYLNTQGLGNRNLIYLLVMINSLNVKNDVALNILTIEEPEAHLCISNEHLLASFINSAIQSSNQLQIFLSTHSAEFLNKLQLENVSVVNEGSAFSLKTSLGSEQLDYLAKKPNMDFLKFLFSRRIILVEGPSEEMLIKSYLSSLGNTLNDIEVISLHKGFTKMIEIWLAVNKKSSHRLGVIRDYDNQPNAQADHERFNINNNVLITTTTEYTLEPEFVKTEGKYLKLKNYFETNEGWENINSADELAEKWKTAKTDTMLKFCRDFGTGELSDIVLPIHISKVLKFLKTGEKS